MNSIVELAAASNFAHNTGKTSNAINSLSELYTNIQRGGGKTLLCIDSNDCQCVGLAFVNMALSYDWGDRDINSVAAENAYYCLAKSFIEKGNTFVMPAIFTMLNSEPSLLNDKFISNWCDMAQRETGISIGMMLGGNPFIDPRLQEFRNQAIGFIKQVQYFALGMFYDIQHSKYKIPTDLSCLIPNQKKIDQYLLSIKKYEDFEHTNYSIVGKKHFEGVYKQCEETLKKN